MSAPATSSPKLLTCCSCHESKPSTEYSNHQLKKNSARLCKICVLDKDIVVPFQQHHIPSLLRDDDTPSMVYPSLPNDPREGRNISNLLSLGFTTSQRKCRNLCNVLVPPFKKQMQQFGNRKNIFIISNISPFHVLNDPRYFTHGLQQLEPVTVQVMANGKTQVMPLQLGGPAQVPLFDEQGQQLNSIHLVSAYYEPTIRFCPLSLPVLMRQYPDMEARFGEDCILRSKMAVTGTNVAVDAAAAVPGASAPLDNRDVVTIAAKSLSLNAHPHDWLVIPRRTGSALWGFYLHDVPNTDGASGPDDDPSGSASLFPTQPHHTLEMSQFREGKEIIMKCNPTLVQQNQKKKVLQDEPDEPGKVLSSPSASSPNSKENYFVCSGCRQQRSTSDYSSTQLKKRWRRICRHCLQSRELVNRCPSPASCSPVSDLKPSVTTASSSSSSTPTVDSQLQLLSTYPRRRIGVHMYALPPGLEKIRLRRNYLVLSNITPVHILTTRRYFTQFGPLPKVALTPVAKVDSMIELTEGGPAIIPCYSENGKLLRLIELDRCYYGGTKVSMSTLSQRALFCQYPDMRMLIGKNVVTFYSKLGISELEPGIECEVKEKEDESSLGGMLKGEEIWLTVPKLRGLHRFYLDDVEDESASYYETDSDSDTSYSLSWHPHPPPPINLNQDEMHIIFDLATNRSICVDNKVLITSDRQMLSLAKGPYAEVGNVKREENVMAR